MSTETEKISKLDIKSGKNKTTKEKYDSFWNKIFYFCLGICAFGIILMVINVFFSFLLDLYSFNGFN